MPVGINFIWSVFAVYYISAKGFRVRETFFTDIWHSVEIQLCEHSGGSTLGQETVLRIAGFLDRQFLNPLLEEVFYKVECFTRCGAGTHAVIVTFVKRQATEIIQPSHIEPSKEGMQLRLSLFYIFLVKSDFLKIYALQECQRLVCS